MMNTGKLKGMTIFITGASRGIGKAIALKAARDGANIVIAAKTADPHPKLKGTIYTAAKEIEEAGGKALPCVVDVRDEAQVLKAVNEAVAKFGGIDIVINNASAISLTSTSDTDMKRYDLMNNINARGTFLVSKLCIPHLKKGKNPHILNISPPLNLNPFWFENHVGYTIAKYGMSMCVLGMHREFKNDGIAVNALWPRTAIITAAIDMLRGSDSSKYCRKPEIMADAAYAILTKDSKTVTGNFFVDDEVLISEGITDMKQYACDPENEENLIPDGFLDIPEDALKKMNVFKKAAILNSSSSKPVNEEIGQVFNTMRAKLTPELLKKTQAIFQFNIKGPKEEETWHVDLKTGSGVVGPGKPASSPDATLSLSSTDFVDLFSGKSNPTTAFMGGKLKISGNMQKAMLLGDIVTSLKSKL